MVHGKSRTVLNSEYPKRPAFLAGEHAKAAQIDGAARLITCVGNYTSGR